MHVVWHVAAMGNWQEVVREQLALLREVRLIEVDCTFVGTGLDWFLPECQAHGIRVRIRRSDPNVMHYETFAMLHIEQRVKTSDEPVLYFHTKGVSNPSDRGKTPWRRLMENHLLRRWRANLAALRDFDAVGVNWISWERPHFSGNFWLATASWLRKLPDFVSYHRSRNFERFSCESWIGSAPGCRAKSLAYLGEPFWERPWRWGDGSIPSASSLAEIAWNYPRTDKGRNSSDGHCYINSFYEDELRCYRDKPVCLLEIGIQSGDSLLLWNDYFAKAEHIIGIDNDYRSLDFTIWPPRVTLLLGDAYRDGSVFFQLPRMFDIVIDDGSHTLEAQIAAVRHYLPKVKPGGLFVVEDIQEIGRTQALLETVPNSQRPYARSLDLRDKFSRADDILFAVKVPEET